LLFIDEVFPFNTKIQDTIHFFYQPLDYFHQILVQIIHFNIIINP